MTRTYSISSIKYRLEKVEGMFDDIYAGGIYRIAIKVKVKYSDKFFKRTYNFSIDGTKHPDYKGFHDIIEKDKLLNYLQVKMSNPEALEREIRDCVYKKVQQHFKEEDHKKRKDDLIDTRYKKIEPKVNNYEII